jgi:large subunit ribosomal protein L18
MKHDLKAIAKKQPSVALRLRRKARIRKIVTGSKERPRLSIFKSAKHIYVQAIDDTSAKTLASVGSLDASIKQKASGMKKVEVAKLVGKMLAEKLKSDDLSAAVFDRNGFRYTGRVAAVADGLREAGLTI